MYVLFTYSRAAMCLDKLTVPGNVSVSHILTLCQFHLNPILDVLSLLVDVTVLEKWLDSITVSGSHELFKFWEIIDNISDTLQDMFTVTVED